MERTWARLTDENIVKALKVPAAIVLALAGVSAFAADEMGDGAAGNQEEAVVTEKRAVPAVGRLCPDRLAARQAEPPANAARTAAGRDGYRFHRRHVLPADRGGPLRADGAEA